MLAGTALAVSGVMLAQVGTHASMIWLLMSYAVFGIGFGLQNPVVFAVAVSGMPLAQAGVAAGIASTARQVGAAIGVAILGARSTLGCVAAAKTWPSPRNQDGGSLLALDCPSSFSGGRVLLRGHLARRPGRRGTSRRLKGKPMTSTPVGRP